MVSILKNFQLGVFINMKNQKVPLANIIIIVAIIGITILTMTGYLSIIGGVFFSLYAVFPYLVSKIAKKKIGMYLLGQ